MKRNNFEIELKELINRHSMENEFGNTPDYILARVAISAMDAFAQHSRSRDHWNNGKKQKQANKGQSEELCNCIGCRISRGELLGPINKPAFKVEVVEIEIPGQVPQQRRHKRRRKSGKPRNRIGY